MRNHNQHHRNTTRIRGYYEKVYANNLDNLEDMDKFLDTHTLPNAKREEIENVNRPITWEDIQSVIKNLPTNMSPGQDGTQGNSTRPLKQS